MSANTTTRNAFPHTHSTRPKVHRQYKRQDIIPPVNSIVRKGKRYGKVASKATTTMFADRQPRVYVLPMDDSDTSWADWWKVEELGVVGVA